MGDSTNIERTSAVEAEVLRKHGFDPDQSRGLFVGISRFQGSEFVQVPFAVDDAIDLAHRFLFDLGLLTASGLVLALAGEPKKKESKQRLSELRRAKVGETPPRFTDLYRLVPELCADSGEQGLFLCSFASHGFSAQGHHYLVVEDSVHHQPERTALEAAFLFESVAAARAKARLVLLDTCRNTVFASRCEGDGEPMGRQFAEAIHKAPGQVVLSAATHGGFAYDDRRRKNGVFSAAVLDGLAGRCPSDERGFITVSKLADFVEARKSEFLRARRPTGWKQSEGIGRHIEGPAGTLPLAINPSFLASRRRYESRRREAFRQLDGRSSTILGPALVTEIRQRLPQSANLEAVEPLLSAIERLDDSEDSERVLRDLFRERYSVSKPAWGRARFTSLLPRWRSESKHSDARSLARNKARGARLGLLGSGSLAPPGRRSWFLGAASVLVVFGVVWIAQSMPGLRSNSKLEPADGLAEKQGLGPGRTLPVQASDQKASDVWVSDRGMRFRFVPAGKYEVGSLEGEPGRDQDEVPAQVTLTRGFWIGETEVTQDQWQGMVKNNPSKFKGCGGNCPVEQVSWFEALEFANRLSVAEARGPCYELAECKGDFSQSDLHCEQVLYRRDDCSGYRLATESEWEVAVRAGSLEATYQGPLEVLGINNAPRLDPIAWYSGNSGVSFTPNADCRQWQEKQYPEQDLCGTHPVGTKKPNDLGLYDMLGNVWEWTYDGDEGGLEIEPGDDPIRHDGDRRIIRGGAWKGRADHVRAASKIARLATNHDDDVGFRLVLTEDEPPK